jgi:hypothetical protein
MSHSSASNVATLNSHHANPSSREFELLCLCATVELSSERGARVSAVIAAGVDWNEFLRVAEHHGLLPLVARTLEGMRGVPPEIAQSLRFSHDTNVRRGLWFAGELARIASRFENQGIKAVPYKGPLLAQAAYGDVALRSFGDLDFLIAPADFERARAALTALGYRPSALQDPALERLWLRYGYERSFDSDAGRYLVELQWGLLPYFFAVGLQVEELLERSGASSLDGYPCRDLSPEDTLLVLCLHAAKHLWMRMIWVCDIAQTVNKQAIDLSLVLERARSLGITRFVLLSFWLAHRLLGASVPAVMEQCFADDPRVNVLGEELVARLARAATYDFESTEYFRWMLRLREQSRDRRRFLWRLVLTPGPGDVAAVKLPQTLFPLYRLVRLLRLLRRFAWPSGRTRT